nr:MFS transporter [uncultured Rhodoferax sp.]
MLSASATRAATPYHRSWVWMFALPQLLGWGSLYYAFALVMGPLEAELGLGRFEVAGAFSLGLLVEGLAAYPVGRLIDQGRERWVMTGGSLLASLGLWLLAQSQGLVGLYFAWCVLGAAMAMVLYTAAFAVVTRRFPGHYRQAIITISLLGGLASTVFIPLVAWLVRVYGWRHAVEVLSLLHLLLCLPIHVKLLHSVSTMASAKPLPTGVEQAELSSLLRSRSYLLVGAFIILITTVSAALPIHLVSMMREFHLPETWAVVVPASLGVFQVIARLVLFSFEKRFDVHLANRVIPALIPLGLLMLLIASFLPSDTAMVFALGFVVLFGMGNGMLTIVKGTAMAQYVSRESVASLNGALGTPLAAARASAPLMLAALWSAPMGYSIGLVALLLVSALAVCALWLAQHRLMVTVHP